MSFSLDLKAFEQKTTAKANAVVRKIVIDVGTSLVMKSPVGDASYWKEPPPKGYVGGRFRANWQYGLDETNSETTENTDKTGAATLSALQSKVNANAAGHIHYITNSLPYAQRLEDGWSRQCPPGGMIALTVQNFQPVVKAAAEALK